MSEYNTNKEAFLAQKQAEREAYLKGVQDALNRLPQQPQEFSRYLTIQGKFPDYSVGNALSVTRYCPAAKSVRLYANWEKLGCTPKAGTKGIPVMVPGTDFTRPDGSRGRHYDLKKAYDVSQLKNPPTLPLRPRDRTLLRGLFEYQAGGWEYRSVPDGPDAQYDPVTNTITIRQKQTIQYLFPALAREVSIADFMMRDGITYEEAAPKGTCVAWMLCSHYEIPPTNLVLPDPTVILGQEPKDYRRHLDMLRMPTLNMVNSVENVVRKLARSKEAESEPGLPKHDEVAGPAL